MYLIIQHLCICSMLGLQYKESIDNNLFDAFLSAGYDPNEFDSFGRGLLEHVLHRNDNEKAVKLIQAGANVNQHMFGLMDDYDVKSLRNAETKIYAIERQRYTATHTVAPKKDLEVRYDQ